MFEMSSNEIKNLDAIFTNLFSRVIKYRFSHDNAVLDYNFDDIKNILQQTDNAIDVVLKGLQCLGNVFSLSSALNKREIVQLWHFIVLITNLIDALNDLRSDCEHSICQ